jgi:hypothetical protein
METWRKRTEEHPETKRRNKNLLQSKEGGEPGQVKLFLVVPLYSFFFGGFGVFGSAAAAGLCSLASSRLGLDSSSVCFAVLHGLLERNGRVKGRVSV